VFDCGHVLRICYVSIFAHIELYLYILVVRRVSKSMAQKQKVPSHIFQILHQTQKTL